MKHILLVDDDPMTLEYLGDFLEEFAVIRKASSGIEALNTLAFNLIFESCDMVVTDYTMPGMNGHQLAQAIKESWPDIKILLHTGDTTIIDSSHIDGIMYKPADRDVFKKTVCRLLGIESSPPR